MGFSATAMVSNGGAWNMASLRSALPSPSPSSSSVRFHATTTMNSGSVSPARRANLKLSLRSYSGLAPLTSHIFATPESESYEVRFRIIDNGGRFSAMRHGRRVPKLNRPPDQRKALLRGLVTQLLKHGRIKTTRARASAMRKFVDKMITLAKNGSLHKRRQALGYVYEKQIVHALFAEVPERYGERNGGYTRIIRTLPRRGDNAPMAYIELV